MGQTILGIVGSYRKGGIVDTLVTETLNEAKKQGATTEILYLLDKHIEFCTNCRNCTQEPGARPGTCIHEDDMQEILDQLDRADGLVLGSPINFFNVTAITRRLLERLICYAYWPWQQAGPKMRTKRREKRAVLITSSAMPAVLGRFLTGGPRTLKIMAKTVGARPVASIFVGMIAGEPHAAPGERAMRKARAAGRKLAAG